MLRDTSSTKGARETTWPQAGSGHLNQQVQPDGQCQGGSDQQLRSQPKEHRQRVPGMPALSWLRAPAVMPAGASVAYAVSIGAC